MADLRWNNITANVGDPNQAMGNAIQAYSNVGNIFGKLRQSILDEEQRAKDNEFRQKQMDENIRQFDMRLGFDAVKHKDDMAYKDKTFEENKRQFGLNYDQNERKMNLDYRARMAGIQAQRDANNINRQLKELQYKDRLQADKLNTMRTNAYVLTGADTDAAKALNDSYMTILKDPNATKEQRLEASQMTKLYNQHISNPSKDDEDRSYRVAETLSPFSPIFANQALDIQKNQITRGAKITKDVEDKYETSLSNADKLAASLNLDTDTVQGISNTASTVQEGLPAGIMFDQSKLIGLLNQQYGTTGNFTDKKKAFDQSGPFNLNTGPESADMRRIVFDNIDKLTIGRSMNAEEKAALKKYLGLNKGQKYAEGDSNVLKDTARFFHNGLVQMGENLANE